MKFQLLFTFLLISSIAYSQGHDSHIPKHVITENGLNIAVYDYEGIKHIFENQNDSTYIINFWATWCIPCVQELPHFEAILKKYKNEKLSVVLVSLDFVNKVDKSLIPFLSKKKLNARVLLLDDDDANSWIDKVDPSWSGALPATVIYNKNGREFFEKSFTFGELEREYLKKQKQE